MIYLLTATEKPLKLRVVLTAGRKQVSRGDSTAVPSLAKTGPCLFVKDRVSLRMCTNSAVRVVSSRIRDGATVQYEMFPMNDSGTIRIVDGERPPLEPLSDAVCMSRTSA